MKKQRQNARAVHSRRLRAIRPYVNFDYDLRKPLTAHAKRKIKEYFESVEALKARNHIVYRPRDPQRLRKAQEFAQHETELPALRVAFIPVANPAVARLKVGKGKNPRFTVKERGITRFGIPFNPRKLVKDPDAHIYELISRHPKVTHYAVQAGKYEISQAIAPKQVSRRVKELMERYSPGGAKFNKRRNSSNHWKEWMHGLNAYLFPDQAAPGEYMQAKLKAAKKLKKARRAERRKQKCRVQGCNNAAVKRGRCSKHQ